MPSDREDAILNPRKGDVWKGKRRVCGNARTITVVRAEDHHVWFEYGAWRWMTFRPRSWFFRWCRTAELVKRGEE